VLGLTSANRQQLSRSLKDLLLILDTVEKAGAGFRSLTGNIDSTTASGRMMMQMLLTRQTIFGTSSDLTPVVSSIWS